MFQRKKYRKKGFVTYQQFSVIILKSIAIFVTIYKQIKKIDKKLNKNRFSTWHLLLFSQTSAGSLHLETQEVPGVCKHWCLLAVFYLESIYLLTLSMVFSSIFYNIIVEIQQLFVLLAHNEVQKRRRLLSLF